MTRKPVLRSFFGLFYHRAIEFEQRPRLRERKMRRREIASQRELARDIHGCGNDSEACTYPNCMCYPYWRNKYRNKIAQKEPLYANPHDPQDVPQSQDISGRLAKLAASFRDRHFAK